MGLNEEDGRAPLQASCRQPPARQMISHRARTTRRATHGPGGQQRLKLNRDLMLRLASALGGGGGGGGGSLPIEPDEAAGPTRDKSSAGRATTAAAAKKLRADFRLTRESESVANRAMGGECKQIVAILDREFDAHEEEQTSGFCTTTTTNKQQHHNHLGNHLGIFKSLPAAVVVVVSLVRNTNQERRRATARNSQRMATTTTTLYCSKTRSELTAEAGDCYDCCDFCLTGCGCEINHKPRLSGAVDAAAAPTSASLSRYNNAAQVATCNAATSCDAIEITSARSLIKVIERQQDGWPCAASLTSAAATTMIVAVFDCERALLVALDSAASVAVVRVKQELDATANNDTRPDRQVASGRHLASTTSIELACSRRRQQQTATNDYLMQQRPVSLTCTRLSRAFIANGERQVQVHADARQRRRRRRRRREERTFMAATGKEPAGGCCHATEQKICKLFESAEGEQSRQQQQREIRRAKSTTTTTTTTCQIKFESLSRGTDDHVYDHGCPTERKETTTTTKLNSKCKRTQATATTKQRQARHETSTSSNGGHDLVAKANCLANYLLALFSLLLLFLLNSRLVRRRRRPTAACGLRLPERTTDHTSSEQISVIDNELHSDRCRARRITTRRRKSIGKIQPRQPMRSAPCSVTTTTSSPCDILRPQQATSTTSSSSTKYDIFTLEKTKNYYWPTGSPTSILNLPLPTTGLPLLLLLLLLMSGGGGLRAPLIQQSSAMQVVPPSATTTTTTTSTTANLNNSIGTRTTATVSIANGVPLETTTTTASLARTPGADELSRAVLATMSTQSSLSVALGGGGGESRKSTRAPLQTRSLAAQTEDESLDDELQPEGEQQQQAGSSLSTARAAASFGTTANEVPPSYGDDLDSAAAAAAAAASAPDDQDFVDQSKKTMRSNSSHDGLLAVGKPASDGGAQQQQQQQMGGAPAGRTKLEGLFDDVTDFSRISAMLAIIVGDICGNSLVILSVVRHSKLRVTTNWFVVSLACADILVALFAMTFNVSVQITGRWVFPALVCDFWNSCDVMASTASILHLCCISIDRYYAIMRPLDYPMKITTRRVCYALAVVWISSALLSFIPIFTGIYTTSDHMRWQLEHPDQCEFVVNRVYALVSSSISFWIPCCIMVFTYYRIYKEASRQEKFIYKAQNMLPAPQVNHHHHHHHHSASGNRAKQHRSKSMAITSLSSASTTGAKSKSSDQANKIKAFAKQTINEMADTPTTPRPMDDLLPARDQPNNLANTANSNMIVAAEQQPLTGSALDLNNNNNNNNNGNNGKPKSKVAPPVSVSKAKLAQSFQPAAQLAQQVQNQDDDDRDSNSGQSTPTKRSISKMKREHKAAKTLGIIMGVFILCWLPFFSWYTPQHICGSACEDMIPRSVVTLLFWIGYFNSTLNPIIYAYFNHEFRDAFKKTLQWIFCCCRDLKCLRVNRPNDNQHYNCTYRSTQEIGLVTNG